MRVNRFTIILCRKRINYGNCNVKSLLSTKDVAIVKVILLDRLDNVYTLFSVEYEDFVACITEQYHKQEYATEGSHSRRQHIFAFLNTQAKRLAELVVLKHLFAKVAILLTILFSSHISHSKSI